MARFPLNAAGLVVLVRANSAIAPFFYFNGLKFDALGRLVIGI